MTYVCITWGQVNNLAKRISILQKKVVRIMNFAAFNACSSQLFEKNKILALVALEKCFFINNCYNKNGFAIFSNSFKFVPDCHRYSTRSEANGLLNLGHRIIIKCYLYNSTTGHLF